MNPLLNQYINKQILASLNENGELGSDHLENIRKIALLVWEEPNIKDIFIITFPNKDGSYCHFNDYTKTEYLNKLANVANHSSSDNEILKFIEDYDCVYEGDISPEKGKFWDIISAVWKSNNETIVFYRMHSMKNY